MKLESLNNGKYVLTHEELLNFQGGRRSNENTYKEIEVFTSPEESNCPCGDHQFQVSYDGPWSSYMLGYCTHKECLECPEEPNV